MGRDGTAVVIPGENAAISFPSESWGLPPNSACPLFGIPFLPDLFTAPLCAGVMTSSIDEDRLSLLLETAYPNASPSELHTARNALMGCTEAEALALLSIAPDHSSAVDWWAGGTDRGRHWPPMQPSIHRWEEYCTHVHNQYIFAE